MLQNWEISIVGYNILFKSICGKSGVVQQAANQNKKDLKEMIQDRNLKIYLMLEEMELLFNVHLKKHEFKDEKCHKGKLSKERIMLRNVSGFFPANMTTVVRP